MNKLAIIGLGYVGLPLAVEFGKKRYVLGFDINLNRINDLQNFYDRTLEVSKEQLSSSKNLVFSSDEKDLEKKDVYIITVPTPIDSAKRPDLNPLKSATNTVAKYLSKDNYVIFESTVYPGCTEEICVPILESVSGLKYNEDFYCGYSPERVNPGDKVNTVTKIKKITSGSNELAADRINSLYEEIIDAGTYKASSIAVAEAAKVIENSQRDLNIAFVNELSQIFNSIDIDTVEVLEAAGSKWNFLPFRPGMVGGHCIGVDPYYLTHKAEEVGHNPQVILAGRRINDEMAKYAAREITLLMLKNNFNISKSKVGVLGITFKENCPDTRNTKINDLITELQRWSISVQVCDPWADKESVKNEYGIDLIDLEELSDLDALIVAVGHNEFRSLKPSDLKLMCTNKHPIIADLKSIYKKNELENAGMSVFRL